jgi:hypothetical protein
LWPWRGSAVPSGKRMAWAAEKVRETVTEKGIGSLIR